MSVKTPQEYRRLAGLAADPVDKALLERAAIVAEQDEVQRQGEKFLYQGTRNPVVQAAEDITAKAIDWAPMMVPGVGGLVVGGIDAATGHLPRRAFNWMTGREDSGGSVGHELAVQAGLTLPGVLQGMGLNKAAIVGKGLASLFGAKVIGDVYSGAQADVQNLGMQPTVSNTLSQMVTPGVQGVTQGGDLLNLFYNAKMVGHGLQAGAAAEMARRGIRPSEIGPKVDKAIEGLPFMGKKGLLRPESYVEDLASLTDMSKADQYNVVKQDNLAKLDPESRSVVDYIGKEGDALFDGKDKVQIKTDALYMRWRRGGQLDVAIDKNGQTRIVTEDAPLQEGESVHSVDLSGTSWENLRDSTFAHELTHARGNIGEAQGDENLAWAVQTLALENPERFEIWADKAKQKEAFQGPKPRISPSRGAELLNTARRQTRGIENLMARERANKPIVSPEEIDTLSRMYEYPPDYSGKPMDPLISAKIRQPSYMSFGEEEKPSFWKTVKGERVEVPEERAKGGVDVAEVRARESMKEVSSKPTPDVPSKPAGSKQEIVQMVEDAVQGRVELDSGELAEVIRTKFTDSDRAELFRIYELLKGEKGKPRLSDAESMAEEGGAVFSPDSLPRIRGGVVEDVAETGLREAVAALAERFPKIDGQIPQVRTIRPRRPLGVFASGVDNDPGLKKEIFDAVKLGETIEVPENSASAIWAWWRDKGKKGNRKSLEEIYGERGLELKLRVSRPAESVTIRNKKSGKLETIQSDAFNVFQTRGDPRIEKKMAASIITAFDKSQPEKLRQAARFTVKMGKLFKESKTKEASKQAFIKELVNLHSPPKDAEGRDEVIARIRKEADFMFESIYNYTQKMAPNEKRATLFEAVQTFDKVLGNERVSEDTVSQLIEKGALSTDFINTLKAIGAEKGKTTPTQEAFLHVNEIKRALQNGMDPDALGVEVDPETGYLRFDNYRFGEISIENLRNWNNIRELNHRIRNMTVAEKKTRYADKLKVFEEKLLPDPLADDIRGAGKRQTMTEDGYPIDVEKDVEAPARFNQVTAERVEGHIGSILNRFSDVSEKIPDEIIDFIENMVPENKSSLYRDLLKEVNAMKDKKADPLSISKAVVKKLNDPVFSYMSFGKPEEATFITKALRGIGQFLHYFDSTRTYFKESLDGLENTFEKFFPNDQKRVSDFTRITREGQEHAIDTIPRQAFVEETAYKHKLPELLNTLDPKSKWFTNATDILEGRLQVSGKDLEMLKAIKGFRDEMTAAFKADGIEYGDAALQSIKDWVPAEFKKKHGGNGTWMMAAYKHLASLTDIDPDAVQSSTLADGVLMANKAEFKALEDSFMKMRSEIINKNPHLTPGAVDAILQFDVMQKLGLYNYDLVGREKATEMAKKIPLGKRKFDNVGNAGETDIREFLPRYVQMTYKNYPALKMREWLIKNVFDKNADVAQTLMAEKKYDQFLKVAEAHLRNEYMSGMETGANESTWLTQMVKKVYGADLSNQIFPHQASMEYLKQKIYQNMLTRPAFLMLNSTDILIKTAMSMGFGNFVKIVPKMWTRMLRNMFGYKKGNDKLVDFLMDNAGSEGNLLAKMSGSGIATEKDAGVVPETMRKLFGDVGGKGYAKAANAWSSLSSLSEGQEKANRAGILGATLENILVQRHGGSTDKRKGYSTYIEAYLDGKLNITDSEWKDIVRQAKGGMLRLQGTKSAMLGGTIADAFVKDAFGKNSGMASLWSMSNMFLNYPINMIVRTVEAMRKRAETAEGKYTGKGKAAKVAGEAIKPAALTALMSLMVYGTAAKMKGEDVDNMQQVLDLAFNEWGIRGMMPASFARDAYNVLTGRFEKGLTGLGRKLIPGIHTALDTEKKIVDPFANIIGGKDK